MALISTTHLAVQLTAPQPPVLLDVRWSLGGPSARERYDAGHLPGAVFIDLDADLAAPPGPEGRHPLPDAGHLQAVLRRAGVNATDLVVGYDAKDGSIAARAWWLLRWAGHDPDRVAVLDGGYATWVAEGREVSTDESQPQQGDMVVRPGHMPVLDADAAAVLASSTHGNLLDARAPERFAGHTEPIDPVAGHIPGALNAPMTSHTGDDGRWRTPEQLAAGFAALGVTPDSQVGAYCGSGVTACSVVFALERAGVTGDQPAALYVGSWSNWCAGPNRPVATGEAG